MTIEKRSNYLLKLSAAGEVSKAVKRGELTRPDICELCKNESRTVKTRGTTRSNIFAHHWNGHENPLDIWWVCSSCNAILRGPHFHSGIVTKEQALSYINEVRLRTKRLKRSL